MRVLFLLAVALAALVGPRDANARKGNKVTVPVDIGLGPAIHTFTGPVANDQMWHYGVVLSVEAVLDKKTIRKFGKRVPKDYREAARAMDEVRISPSIFIPDTLFVSPKTENTSVYGISWRPIALGVPLIGEPFRLSLDAGARLTWAWVQSDALAAQSTHFVRPGIDLKGELEVPFSKSLLVSTGWVSMAHIPQVVGGSFTAVSPLDASIWHVGQAFAKVHVRVPYAVRL